MNYIEENKAAWEEAFEKRDKDWGIDIVERINNESFPFLEKEMISILKKHDVKGKTVAQFCCNNGRELLSVVKNGAKEGYGFDIAENQINFANSISGALGLNCKFIAANILDIGEEYHNKFDLIIITIGAISWFKDLNLFFPVASKCLVKKGVLIINEQHPLANMFAAPGESNYSEGEPAKIVNSYFKKEWIENDGMYYMTKKVYDSKTFISYSHSFEAIIQSICKNGMVITGLKENDKDISGLFKQLEGKEIPLSYILEARKE